MSYIDAFLDTYKNIVKVIEKHDNKIVFNDLDPVYEFYVADKDGKYTSINDIKAKKIVCNNKKDFLTKLKEYKETNVPLFESDHNILFKTLNKHYKGTLPTNLNIAFIDIENMMDETERNASKCAQDPKKPITAITVYKKWEKKCYTYTIKPETYSLLEAQEVCSNIPNVFLCTDENALLNCFLESIKDVDIISGWNSSTYDLPYIIGRIKKVLGEQHVCKLCYWNKKPIEKTIDNYGTKITEYTLIGKIHIDYLLLYQKHDQQTKESYSLNSIGEEEVGESKIEYEGTLDDLYLNEYELFIRYNIQDTLLLAKIDEKLEYITLSYHIAHNNGVTISSTLGSVAWIDQSIINEAHEQGFIIPDKKHVDLEKPAAGARVADAVVGVHQWIGSIDLASLYPSTIRMLNMSPETMIGQVRLTKTDKFLHEKIEKDDLYENKDGVKTIKWAEAWNGLFSVIEYDLIQNQTDDVLTVDFIDGSSQEITAKELYHFLYNNNLSISANVTIFRNDKDGVIPTLLSKWFSERKALKNQLKDVNQLLNGIKLDEDLVKEILKC